MVTKFLRCLVPAVLLINVSSGAEITPESVAIPMRDGVKLAADLYRATQGRAPVLLMRTPYNKRSARSTAEKYSAAGYNVVVQDTRGRFGSEGAFYPYNSEGQDGYDTLDWLRKQSWSDGRVGMWGASYVGAVQWQAAAEGAPGLVVLTPTATWSSFYRNIYLGGVARLSLIAQAAAGMEAKPADFKGAPVDWPRTLLHLPLASLDQAIGWNMPWLSGILAHPRPDGFWKRLDVTDAVRDNNLPSQHVVGYYDFFCREVVANFNRTRTTAKQLILGPWDHGTIGKSKVGDVEFGPNAQLDLVAENLTWFNRFLKQENTHYSPVRYFSMGDNMWHNAKSWPPAQAKLTSFYLHSDGHANTRNGSGLLSRTSPNMEPVDKFMSDPADPVPSFAPIGKRTLADAVWGPVDQSFSEGRKDVLVYSTDPVTRPLRFAGPIKAELSVAANTPDADWVVKIVDVRPDGFAQNLAVGVQRSSFRESELSPIPLVAGKVYLIKVDLGHAAAQIAPGHRLRVEVTGSYFPLFERNTNTGEGPYQGATLVSTQTVNHRTGAMSRIVLPLMEESR